VIVDTALGQISSLFDQMYSEIGRPSIAPEKLLRAQLLQMLYSIRSERLLIRNRLQRAQNTSVHKIGAGARLAR
jgi:transposase